MYLKCKILVIYRARIGYSKLGYPRIIPKPNFRFGWVLFYTNSKSSNKILFSDQFELKFPELSQAKSSQAGF